MNSLVFELGREVTFQYHGTNRRGIVERVTEEIVILRLAPYGWESIATPEQQKGPSYKSFRFDKIGK